MPKYRLGMCVTSRLLQAFTRPSFRFSPLWNIVSVAAMFSSVFVTERCKQAMQAWVNANLQGRTNLTLYVHSTKSQSLLLYLKSGLVTEQRDCGQYWTLWKRNVSSPRGWKIEPLTPTVRGSGGCVIQWEHFAAMVWVLLAAETERSLQVKLLYTPIILSWVEWFLPGW